MPEKRPGETIEFSPLTWYRKYGQATKRPPFVQPVPCGDCRACCEHGRVVLYPPFDDVNSYGHQIEPDGTAVLTRHPDGHCLYLHQGECLIYARRPMTCRSFDCRALLVADVHQPETFYAAVNEKFSVVCKQPGDREFLHETRAAARTAEARGDSHEQQLRAALFPQAVTKSVSLTEVKRRAAIKHHG